MTSAVGNDDVVWVDVLPSLKRLGPALRKGLGKVSADAGRTSGEAYGKSFETAAAKQVEKASTRLAASKKTLEAASIKVGQAQYREADAAGKVAVAQARLIEVVNKGGASAAQLSAATNKVAAEQGRLEKLQKSGRATQLELAQANDRVAAAQERLVDLGNRGRASTAQLAAATEGLNSARRTQMQRASEAAAAERRHGDASDEVARSTRLLSEAQEQASSKGGRLSAMFRSLDTDSRRSADGMRTLRGAGSALGGVLGGLKSFTTLSFVALGSQAAVGGIIALTGAVSGAIGVLALLPAAVVAAAAPLGALAVGLMGVGDAFKAQSAASAEGGAAARSAASAQEAAARQVESAQKGVVAAGRQVESAQRGVVDAGRGVEQAHRGIADAGRALTAAERGVESALRGVTEAEKRQTEAAQDARDAQRDLNDARATALQQLADLNRSLSTASLDEEDAVLGVQRAQERLNEAVAAGSEASELDRKEADLAYRQAVARLEDVRIRNARLADETAAANAAGVEGSDVVTAARERIADAADGEVDAQRALEDARLGVSDAEQQVADARLGVTDADRALADAQVGVADAQRDLADARTGVADAEKEVGRALAAVAAAAATASPAAEKLQAAMDGLSPSARSFVTQIMGLKPAFDSVRLDVQERLFAGLGDRIDGLAGTYLPIMRTALGGLADDLNGASKGVADFFLLPSTSGDWTTILANGRTATQSLLGAMTPLLGIFTDLAAVGSTFLPGLADGLGGAISGLADFVSEARESGQLATFMQNALDVAGQLGAVLGNVGSIIASVFGAAGDTGALGSLQAITGELATFLDSDVGQSQLAGFFASTGEAIGALLPLISTFGDIFLGTIGPALAGFATDLAPVVNTVMVALGDAFRQIAPIMPQLAAAVTSVVTAFLPLIPVLADLVTSLLPPLLTVVTAIAPVLPAIAGGVLGVIGGLRTWSIVQGVLNAVMRANPLMLVAGLIAGLIGYLVTAYQTSDTFRAQVDGAFRAVGDAATWMWENAIQPTFAFFKAGWEGLVTGINWVWTNVLSPVFSAVGTVLSGVWTGVLQPVFTFIGEAWSGLATGMTTVYNEVIAPIFGWFGGVLTTIRDGFGTAVEFIGQVWGGLRDTLMAPVQWVIDFVWNDGLRRLWNTINNLWDGEDLAPFVLTTAATGTPSAPTGAGTSGTGGTTTRLADGGVMPGHTPGRDVHWFTSPTGGTLGLSGGEAVMRPEFTRALGVPTINLLNDMARTQGEAGLRSALAGGAWGQEGLPPRGQALASGGVIDLPGWLDTTLSLPGMGGVRDIVSTLNSGTGFGGGLWGGALLGTAKKAGSNLLDAVKGLLGLDDVEAVGKDIGPGGIPAAGQPSTGGRFPTKRSGWPPRRQGVVSGNTAAAIAAVKAAYPQIKSVGTIGARPNASDHPTGKAADFMIPGWQTPAGRALGYEIADFLGSRSEQFGLNYNIFNDQISSGQGWRAYTHPNGATSNPTLRHLDHLHSSFFDRGGLWEPGVIGMNHTDGMERVLTPPQDNYFQRFVDVGESYRDQTPQEVNGFVNHGTVHVVDLADLERGQRRVMRRALAKAGPR